MTVKDFGKLIIAICAECEKEFSTSSKIALFCSPACSKRQRHREYMRRRRRRDEYEKTLAEPEGWYRVRIREWATQEPAPLRTERRQQQTVGYRKAPIARMADFQMFPGVSNVPVPFTDGCPHGLQEYCVECDFG